MTSILVLLVMAALTVLPRCCHSNQVNRTVINIGVILTTFNDKHGYRRALSLAKSRIENSTKFSHLNELYEIQLMTKIDVNSASLSIKYAYEMAFDSNPKPLAFIGPMHPLNVVYAATTLDTYKWLIVTAASNVNNDKDQNLRLLSSSTGIDQEVKARVVFLKKFEWKRVAFIYSLQHNYATTYMDKMLDKFEIEKIELIGKAGIEVRKTRLENNLDVLRTKLRALKKNDTKIFIAEVDPYEALVLFCEVKKLNMYGEDVVWIINSHAKLLDDWVYFNNTMHQIVSCSREQLQEVITRSFIFQEQLIREDNVKTDSGLTASEYLDTIVSMWNMTNKTSYATDRNSLEISSLAFDALWAVAMALNNSIDILNSSKPPIKLAMDLSSYNSFSTVQKTLFDQMKKVDFQGMAGPYSYFPSPNPINKDGTVKLMQYKDAGTRLTRVGQFDTKTDSLTFLNDTRYLWKDGKVPLDRSIVEEQVLTIDKGLYIAITTFATIGIFLGIMFLTFNLVYGKYKFIKLSAPLFNNIIAFGCILCLVSVFLFGVHDIKNPETSFALVCKARAWTLTIGFSCAFGAMFVKTWRIYKICTNKKLRMKLGPLSNWYLLSLIGAIVFIDLIILVTWELVDPLLHGKTVVPPLTADPAKRFKYYRKVLNVCKASNMVLWLAVFYVYKGILILYGLFLAYETRNVIYAHLNDSRVIGICVYNVVVLSVVGAFLSLLLEAKNYKEMYIVLAVCITFPAGATICLMMFPKIAYRCKTDNLDDTETIANGMTTIRNSFDVSTMNAPQIHITTHVPDFVTPQPSTCSKDSKFAYDNREISADSNPGSETCSQNGVVKSKD